MCGQALAPRSTRRAGCPGGDIVPLRRGVGLRHRLVSLSDIMCDWPSARPPAAGTDAGAGAWAHLRAAGTLLPPPCGLPVSTARPRVSPPRNQDGPRRTAQPRRDPRTGRCSAADHFLCSLRGLFTGERPGWVGPEGGHVPGGAGVSGLPLTLPSSTPEGDRDPPASQGEPSGSQVLNPRRRVLSLNPRSYSKRKAALFLFHCKARWVAQVHTANKGWCT